ncbi:hypothetical protein EJ110_NYTH23877 [Nymphaea thermarum]|nr:hypothetical protein EJ110_NYTH23877 [Nymphaea thermarum]
MAARLQHGSHAHPLQQMGVSETNGRATSCRACGQPFASELALFGCRGCGFFLHRFCALQPPSLPGDPAYHQHQLRLLYAPAYPSGNFGCDICRKVGSALNYHCRSCNFDAHPLCANMPRTARRPGHEHPLRFLFKPTAAGSTRCDVCGRQGLR